MYTIKSHRNNLTISTFLWRLFHFKHLWWSNVRWEFVLLSYRLYKPKKKSWKAIPPCTVDRTLYCRSKPNGRAHCPWRMNGYENASNKNCSTDKNATVAFLPGREYADISCKIYNYFFFAFFFTFWSRVDRTVIIG